MAVNFDYVKAKWEQERQLRKQKGKAEKQKALAGIERCSVETQVISNDLPQFEDYDCDNDDDGYEKYQMAKEKATKDLILKHGEGIKYLIVQTDYFGQMFIPEDEDEADYDYNPKNDSEILYVYDNLWGEGLYFGAGKETDRKELMSIIGIEDGIYLKVDGEQSILDKIEFLMGLEYCGCFSWDTLDQVIVTTSSNGIKVMTVLFDTEHG